MNDIQKNYLTGLVIQKLHELDENSLMEVNINNERFYSDAEAFIEKYCDNLPLAKETLSFLTNEDELHFSQDDVIMEKIGLYVSIKDGDNVLTLKLDELTDLVMMIVCYMQDYLPLGSIVKINEGEREQLVMIEQRMVQLKGKSYYIDYRGVPYPTGIFNEKMYLYFSASQIIDVFFKGYSDFENEGYELALKENLIGNGIFSKEYLIQSEE